MDVMVKEAQKDDLKPIPESLFYALKDSKGKIIGVVAVDNYFKEQPIPEEQVAKLQRFADQAAIAIENATLYANLKKAYLDAIRMLAFAVDAKDHYTLGHSDKVGSIAKSIAREMGLDPAQVEEIEYGAILHDVGKIAISEKILNKPGRLTDEEYVLMKKHTVMGVNIMEHTEAIANLMPIVRHHHEWYNGKGYPDGLKGEAIPMGARIVALADAFDTMVSDRPYRKVLGIPAAISEIKRFSGTQFDPKVVEALLNLLKRHENIYDQSTFLMESSIG